MTDLEPTFTARNTAPAVGIPTAAERIELGRTESQIDLDVAHEIATSDMLPAAYKSKPAQTVRANLIVVFGLGRALGIDRVAALYGFHVIENTPSPSAKLQAALVRRAGHVLRVKERSSTRAVCQIVRADDPEYPVTVEYDIADARNAGYLDVWCVTWAKNSEGRNKATRWDFPAGLGIDATDPELKAAKAPQWVLDANPADRKRKDNWHTNTRSMLWHRAVTECVGAACPEVLSGLDFDYAPEPFAPTIDVRETDPVDILTDTADIDDIGDIEEAVLEDTETEGAELVPEPAETMDVDGLKQAITDGGYDVKDVLKANPGKTLDNIVADPDLLAAVLDMIESRAL